MAMRIVVSLLSGRHVSVEISAEAKISSLRCRSAAELGARTCALAGPWGGLLRDADTLAEAGVRDGDTLTAIARHTDVLMSRGACAKLLSDGSVETRGRKDYGGDSSSVQERLRDVHQLQATKYAFAALLEDGSVVTWGHPLRGGDSRAVQEQLKGVKQIQATNLAFAAICDNGSVVTWGDDFSGGDSSFLQGELQNVEKIQ
ncbi:unnamed protein product, partial [Symbiodinium microadriaticum]